MNLTGVSCATATRCMAVGSYGTPKGIGLVLHPVSEQMKGTTWTSRSTIPLPASATGGSLTGVSCTAATDCTAVGSYGTSKGIIGSLAEHWNGRAWAVQATPNPGSTKVLADVFTAIACGSATSCVGAGSEVNNGRTAYPLAEAWNGRAWTVQQTAAPELRDEGLEGLACVSGTTCTAVGSYSLKTVADLLPLAERTGQA